MTSLPPFGTPEYLDVAAGAVRPVVDGVERTTTWAYPDRASLRAAMDDAEPGRFYPRYGHPNSLLLEAWMARLEGAEACVSFASGMAAISAIPLALLSSGDRWAYAAACYGGTHAFAKDLPRFGITADRFDSFSSDSLDEVLARGAVLVHVESPVNPTGRILELTRVAERVHAAGALLSCDVTFMPPPVQRSLTSGVDLAVHSATKFLGGHSDILAGVVSGSRELIAKLERWRRRSGAVLGPDESWLLRRSLETVEIRTRAQCETAEELARWLAKDDRVERVHHAALDEDASELRLAQQSGLGGAVMAFEPRGGDATTTRVFDALRVFRRAVSLGGVESLASIPVDSSHHSYSSDEIRAFGFAPHAIRLSVGLEPVEELRRDLDRALGGA